MGLLGVLADCLAEASDPRERWVRRHMQLRSKLAGLAARIKGRGASKNELRKLDRRRRRLDYALQVQF